MLATASYPSPALQPSQEDASQYRPTKDIESFKALFPQPVEFAEGSSTGGLAIPEHKYQPLNDSASSSCKPEKSASSTSPSRPAPVKSTSTPQSPSIQSLYASPINLTWPDTVKSAGSGLINIGNTCFLNSTLQCLLHIPPLLRILISHSEKQCKARPFCMTCEMRKTVIQAHGMPNSPFCPTIATKLHVIAKHMKKGRQEDSHEFLRYAIDALQKSCLAGLPPKIDHKLAETTWVHKLFGGRLRSRVTCGQCGFNSDTMDSILDLSLDISNISTLKEAFQKFVGIDHLKGGNKYKCEKCKKLVPAEKQFTIHDAPLILTVHLKRFSPIGRKIGHFVKYDQMLKLQPYMSEGQHGPTYSLFGVVCHAGGGPHSGHYIAHVKDRNGRWWEMNDDLKSKSNPFDLKSAYMLFYTQESTQAPPSSPSHAQVDGTPSKKRKLQVDEDASASAVINGESRPFIGPIIPSSLANPLKRQKSDPIKDSQADSLRRKIDATVRSKASLVDESYGSDGDGASSVATATTNPEISALHGTPTSSHKSPTQVDSSPTTPSSLGAIDPGNFYGASPKFKQNGGNAGKSMGTLSRAMRDRHGRPNNPYNSIGPNSHDKKLMKRRRLRAL